MSSSNQSLSEVIDIAASITRDNDGLQKCYRCPVLHPVANMKKVRDKSIPADLASNIVMVCMPCFEKLAAKASTIRLPQARTESEKSQQNVAVVNNQLIESAMSSEGIQQLVHSVVRQSMQQIRGPEGFNANPGILFPTSVRADVNAAQRGQGVAPVVARSAPNVAYHGPTYYCHNPTPPLLGQELQFKPQKQKRQSIKKLTSAQLMPPPPPPPISPQESIGIEVSLVYLGPSHTLKKIGTLIEAANDVDAHIGVAALHRLCFDLLLLRWAQWAHHTTPLRLEDTTVHFKSHIAALAPPADRLDRDALYKACIDSRTHRFKPKVLKLSLCISQSLYEQGSMAHMQHLDDNKEEGLGGMEMKRNREVNGDESASKTPVFIAQTPSKTAGSESALFRSATSSATVSNIVRSEDTNTSTFKRGRSEADSDDDMYFNPGDDLSSVTPSTPPRSPKRLIPPGVFVSPPRASVQAALSLQEKPKALDMLPLHSRKVYNCEFYVIDQDITFNDLLEEPQIDWESAPKFTGLLDANFDPNNRLGREGSFKTAHPGSIITGSIAPAHTYSAAAHTITIATSNDPLAPIRPFLGKTICVKQVFRKGEKDKTLKRFKGMPELSRIWLEVMCLKWGSAALLMVYHWMERQRRELNLPHIAFPQMFFVRSMMAVATSGSNESRTFLIEEFIDFRVEGPFIKYINNALPRPNDILIGDDLDRAEFLCFAQHVQWLKTHQMMFTSDYQGGKTLLTDPQILTSQKAKSNAPLFAGGNVGFDAFTGAAGHMCNRYCVHFGLEPLVRTIVTSTANALGQGNSGDDSGNVLDGMVNTATDGGSDDKNENSSADEDGGPEAEMEKA